jgi:hypothetical protein
MQQGGKGGVILRPAQLAAQTQHITTSTLISPVPPLHLSLKLPLLNPPPLPPHLSVCSSRTVSWNLSSSSHMARVNISRSERLASFSPAQRHQSQVRPQGTNQPPEEAPIVTVIVRSAKGGGIDCERDREIGQWRKHRL